MSQIDMVVFQPDSPDSRPDGPDRRVCGDFDPPVEEARLVEIYVIVRQGDVVVRGHGRCVGANWQVPIETPEQLAVGRSAIASAVAILEKEPAGLEMLSWVQEVEVLGGRQSANVPLDFPEPELVLSAQGQLANERTVSSSLAIFEANPQREETARWRQEFSIRPVVPAQG